MDDGNKLSGLVLLRELGNKDVNAKGQTQPFTFLRDKLCTMRFNMLESGR